MTKNIRNWFLFCLVVVLMSGCMQYAPALYPDDALEPAKGYLYGRFSDAPGFSLGAAKMGVVVTSVDRRNEIALMFLTLDPYAVAVDPGDYRLTHIVYTRGATNEKEGEKPFPEELAGRVIHVEAGKAYYIGDFDGATKSTFMVLFIASEWRLGKVTNDFAGTTAKLDALLPQMKDVPKVDVFGDALVTAFSHTGAPKAAISTTPVVLPPAK